MTPDTEPEASRGSVSLEFATTGLSGGQFHVVKVRHSPHSHPPDGQTQRRDARNQQNYARRDNQYNFAPGCLLLLLRRFSLIRFSLVKQLPFSCENAGVSIMSLSAEAHIRGYSGGLGCEGQAAQEAGTLRVMASSGCELGPSLPTIH